MIEGIKQALVCAEGAVALEREPGTTRCRWVLLGTPQPWRASEAAAVSEAHNSKTYFRAHLDRYGPSRANRHRSVANS